MSETPLAATPPAAEPRSRAARPVLYLLAVLLQMAVIGGIAWNAQSNAESGTTIYARIEPVDPRDPFRGDYLTFRFEDLSSFAVYETEQPDAGDTVYVPVQRSGRYWTPTGGPTLAAPPSDSAPEYDTNALYLRATVRGPANNDEIEVTYGAEEYFVEEGAGTRFPTGKDVIARLSVSDDGDVMLREILVDGKSWP